MEPGELLRICDTVPENGTGKDCPNPAQEARQRRGHALRGPQSDFLSALDTGTRTESTEGKWRTEYPQNTPKWHI